MSEPEKGISPMPMSDKVLAKHIRKNEKGEVVDVETHSKNENVGIMGLVQKIPENRFCFECGERLSPLMILYCKKCGQRYLVQYDDVLHKPIVVPIGKEPELTKLEKE